MGQGERRGRSLHEQRLILSVLAAIAETVQDRSVALPTDSGREAVKGPTSLRRPDRCLLWRSLKP